MKAAMRWLLVMALALVAGLMERAHGAVPTVVLESDPGSLLLCATQAADKLTVSGATTSAVNDSGLGLHLYQTAFNTTTWSGSLKKFRLNFVDDSNASGLDSVLVWDAADILTGTASMPAQPVAAARRIYTSTSGESLLTIPFAWDALPTAQQAKLHISPDSNMADGLGEKRLEYLRGERRYESGSAEGIFPPRERVLGAIVHSTPVYVGAPSAGLQGQDYLAFYEANKSRRPAIYVGADDGMLHGFDADSGEELFAYIPQAVFHRLDQLTMPSKIRRPYVDGAIAVAEAQVGNQWRTVLAAGMGGGAQGLFALDVTRPDQFADGMGALWEFTDADDADIGDVVGAPAIAKFKIGTANGVSVYRDFVVVASGLNNYRDDGAGKFNAQAANALFLLALDKAKSDKWRLNVNYYKFVMPISDRHRANGLITATPVYASDGSVTYLYAGDLQGNVWRLAFNGYAPWPNALDSASNPLFIAKDANGNRQAITQKIQAAFAPAGYLLLFGTGKFLESGDLDNNHYGKQSFYAILDSIADKSNSKISGRSQLMERELTGSDSIDGALEIKGGDLQYGMPGANKKGWYFDFIDSHISGERSISPAQLMDGKLFFNTLIPNPDPCQSHGGRSYALDVLTGLPVNASFSAYPFISGIPGLPVLTLQVPELVTQRDAIGKRRVKQRVEALAPTADGFSEGMAPVQKPPIEFVTTAGRLSWREIVNWLDVRSSSKKK